MSERRILTLHMPQHAGVMDDLLTAIESALHVAGAGRVWIDPTSSHDLVVMADLPSSPVAPAAAAAAAAVAGAVAASPASGPGGSMVPEPRAGELTAE